MSLWWPNFRTHYFGYMYNHFRKDTIVVGICLSISLIGVLISIISKYISRQIIQRIPQSNILTLPTIYQEELFQITTFHSKDRIVQVQPIYKNDTGDLFLWFTPNKTSPVLFSEETHGNILIRKKILNTHNFLPRNNLIL